MKMKKLFFVLLTLTACGSDPDSSICECLEAGKKLNEFSSEILSRKINRNDEVKLRKMKSVKEEKCMDFQSMDGKKMLELKKECE